MTSFSLFGQDSERTSHHCTHLQDSFIIYRYLLPLRLTTFWEMGVNLDQIEFYHGPSRQPPFTSAKSVTPGHVPAHVSRYFQQSFPAGSSFRPGQPSQLTGRAHEWNIFDFEINNVYGPTRPEVTKDVEPPVTTNIPAACDILLERGTSALAFSEPVPLTDSPKTISCLSGPDMPGNDLPGKLAQY